MGVVFWQFPFSLDLPARRKPRQGRYLGDMSISRAESIHLVEQALIEGPTEGMTGNQVWEALDRAVPEHTVRLMLGEMVHKGLVEREATFRFGRRKAISVFRAL